jgi:uncharacterized protein (DUF58 family)
MKIRWLLIIILLLTVVLALAGGFTMLWKFFIFLIALLFISYYWMRLSIRNVSGRVEKLPQYCYIGERFEEEFTFYNSGRVPTTLLEVREDTDLPGYKSVATFYLPAKGSHTWRSEGVCRRRGQYVMGRLTVRITDFLGFFSIKRQFIESKNIIVYPVTIDLPFFQAFPRQEPGLNPRRWFSSESGTDAARVREYSSGDSLRHIHWRTTAHAGNLMVKEFDPDRVSLIYKDIWVVLDMQRAVHCGEGEETTEEYGISIAASLVKKYMDRGKRVGLISSSERNFIFLPDTGDEHLTNMMRALAMIKATGELSIDALLASQEERFEEGSAVVVITPAGNIQAPLRRVVNRNTVVTAVLLDGASFGGKISAIDTARGLVAGGIHVHIVKSGAEISRTLDSRFIFTPVQYRE